jgi:hypothetical protein
MLIRLTVVRNPCLNVTLCMKINTMIQAYISLYRVGHEKVARLPFARVLVIFSLALVYCVE